MKRMFNYMLAVVGIIATGIGQTDAATVNENEVSVTNSASVKSQPISRTLEISQKIDELVTKNLATKKLKPNPIASDTIFLRRAYLDIIGRIPTAEEAKKFLKDASSNKRQHLIDQLLDSEGFASHQFNYFADLLRIKSRLRNISGSPYLNFVKDSIRENKPYDKFVRELLSTEGNYAEKGKGAVGYYLRDFGMPEDNMSNTVRVFLGTRLECAQCHDHPFDVWTQRDYFEMVAFTGGVLMRVDPPFEGANELRTMTRKGEIDESTRRNLQNILRPLGYGVKGSGTGLARLPDDYQESDGEANEIVTAKTMFEKKELVVPELPAIKNSKKRKNNNRNNNLIRGAKQVDSRLAYAEWMTARDNPRFTTVIANRMWKRAMGIGLIEPVDIITEETDPSNPELMEYLTETMIDLNFDLKQFLRAVYNSQTYQREACVSDLETPTEYTFRGPLLRRMSGEQIWDSLLTMTVEDVDQLKGTDLGRSYLGMDITEVYEKTSKMSMDEILDLAKLSREELRKMYPPKGTEETAAAEKQYKRKMASYNQKVSELKKRQKQATRKRDFETLKEIRSEFKSLMKARPDRPNRLNREMVRASELPSPAPAGHLAREFGQSDREQIENANKEPAVTQVLTMMNGYVAKYVSTNPYSPLMHSVANGKSPQDKIDAIFLTILSRYPTEQEREVWLDESSAEGRSVAQDLIWTLVNNSEFLFVQ